jgi:hypothetical protein
MQRPGKTVYGHCTAPSRLKACRWFCLGCDGKSNSRVGYVSHPHNKGNKISGCELHMVLCSVRHLDFVPTSAAAHGAVLCTAPWLCAYQCRSTWCCALYGTLTSYLPVPQHLVLCSVRHLDFVPTSDAALGAVLCTAPWLRTTSAAALGAVLCTAPWLCTYQWRSTLCCALYGTLTVPTSAAAHGAVLCTAPWLCTYQWRRTWCCALYGTLTLCLPVPQHCQDVACLVYSREIRDFSVWSLSRSYVGSNI